MAQAAPGGGGGGGDAGSYQRMLGPPCVCAPFQCTCHAGSSTVRDVAIGAICLVVGSAATLLVAYIHKLRRRANAARNPAPSPAFGVPQPPLPSFGVPQPPPPAFGVPEPPPPYHYHL